MSESIIEQRRGFMIEQPTIRATAAGRVNEADAAKYLGVSARKMRQMRADDEGPSYSLIGNRIWYALNDLDIYIEACRHETAR